MSSNPAQVVDPQEFIPLLDYHFTGDEVTVEKKRIFIAELRAESTVYHAAQHTGISRKTAYQWYHNDPGFAEAWEDSMQDAADVMEHSVYHQALNGDSLLKMFWLKRYRPAFRDKVTVDIQVVDDEIQERMRQAGIKQLPPASEVFRQFAATCDDLQKEPVPAPAAPTSE